jgi:polysaccharide export outer membrane protein
MMKHRKTFIAVVMFALALGVATAYAQKPEESKPAPLAVQETYLIGESDLLAINVWHEAELTRVVPVRTDGKITLPLIGELQASGQTVEQLRATIATELKRFLEDPEVTVIVPLGQRLTVIEGIALGGGFKDFAKVGKIQIVRTHRDGRVERLPFDYKHAVDGDLTQNFALEAHDMIIVP